MDHSFVVRINAGSKFGTGVLVSPGHVLTCAHVVSNFKPLKPDRKDWEPPYPEITVHLGSSGGLKAEQRRASVRGFSERDLALLAIDEVRGRPNLRFYRAANAIIQSPENPDRFIVGFDHPESVDPLIVPFSELILFALQGRGETLTQYQIDGGVPDGTSGGPLLVPLAGDWIGLGLVQLGGLSAGRSRFIAPSAILDFLEARGIQAELKGPLPFRVPAVGAASLGALIRNRRMSLLAGRRELASQFNVDEATVEAWEEGRGDLPMSVRPGLWECLIRGDVQAVEDWLRFSEVPDLLRLVRDRQSADAACRILPLRPWRVRGLSGLGVWRVPLPKGSQARVHVFLPEAAQLIFLDVEQLETWPRRYTLIGPDRLPSVLSSGGDYLLPELTSLPVTGPPGINCLMMLAASMQLDRPWGEIQRENRTRVLDEHEWMDLWDRLYSLGLQNYRICMCEYDVV